MFGNLIRSDHAGNRSKESDNLKCRPRPKTLKVRFYADSQGRGVYKDFNSSIHNFCSMVKPGAKFRNVVEMDQVNCSDVTVFLAGTNDIACNERK